MTRAKLVNQMERLSFDCALALALLAGALVLGTAVRASAQQKVFAYELKKEWPLAFAKGSTVVVKIPTRLWQEENDQRKDLKLWSPFSNEKGPAGTGAAYFVDVQDILNQPDWASRGFPFCGEFTLTRLFELRSAFRHHQLPYTEVELQSGNMYLRFHFAHPYNQADALNAELQQLIVSGGWERFESTEDFRKNVFEVQETKIFTGPMARLSYDTKVALLHMACTGENTFATETYKGRTYFSVGLHSDGQVYNSTKLNSSVRVATVINERIIPMVKAFKRPTQESGIDGLKFAAPIYYRDFVSEVVAQHDQLEIYLPLDLIQKFVDADITSQQLVDGSVVLLNGNRVQVSLAAG